MKRDILAAVADGAMTTHPSRPAGRGSKRRRDTLEFGVKLLFLLCGCVAVGCVLFICIYLIVAGLPAVLEIGITDFLFGTEWAGKQGQFGILPFILTSVAGTAGAVLVGVPVGILTAMFLAKVAPPKAARVIRTAVELLAGIPSVVYGFFGLVAVVPLVRDVFDLPVGETALAGSLILAIMALPTIITVAEDTIRTTPRAMRESSLALGATHWQTIRRVVLPYSASGIAAAAVLGIGRAVGETMAVLMVTGNAAVVPHSLLEPVRTIPATIAAELGEAPAGGAHYEALFMLGCILFLLTLLLSIAVEMISARRPKTM